MEDVSTCVCLHCIVTELFHLDAQFAFLFPHSHRATRVVHGTDVLRENQERRQVAEVDVVTRLWHESRRVLRFPKRLHQSARQFRRLVMSVRTRPRRVASSMQLTSSRRLRSSRSVGTGWRKVTESTILATAVAIHCLTSSVAPSRQCSRT